MKNQLQLLRGKQDVIIATPGRLVHMLKEETLTLKQVENLVLDEVDQMLDMGFEREIDEILERIEIQRENLQVSFFSATIPQWLKNTFENSFEKELIKVNLIGTEEQFLPVQIKNYKIECDNKAEKQNILLELITEILYKQPDSKILVFLNTKNELKDLQKKK